MDKINKLNDILKLAREVLDQLNKYREDILKADDMIEEAEMYMHKVSDTAYNVFNSREMKKDLLYYFLRNETNSVKLQEESKKFEEKYGVFNWILNFNIDEMERDEDYDIDDIIYYFNESVEKIEEFISNNNSN